MMASQGETVASSDPVPRRARRKPGENRLRLIESGIRSFGLLGYHGASTSDIARDALVPQPHVYANFSTKRDLFLACLDEVLSNLDRSPSIEHALFIFQCIAVTRDTSLSAALQKPLREVERSLGPLQFSEMLVGAARALRNENA